MQPKIHNRKKAHNRNVLNVGFLSTIDNPLLPLLIYKISQNKLRNVYIICDQSKTSLKMQKVFKERVGDFFDKLNIFNVKNKAPFFFVDNHNGKQNIELIKKLKINCLYNAGILKKLSIKVIKKVKYGCINVHPAILPKYRGASSTEWSIYNKDKIANTVHFMNKNYDEGPIINIQYYRFSKNTKYHDIRKKVYIKGIDLGLQTLLNIQKKKLDYRKLIKQKKNEGITYRPISKKKLDLIIKKVNKYGYK